MFSMNIVSATTLDHFTSDLKILIYFISVVSDGSGKTLLDAFIYYAPVSNTRKVTICSKMQNVTTANLFSSTTPAIELVQRITYGKN